MKNNFTEEKEILDALLVNVEMLESYNNLIYEKLKNVEEEANKVGKDDDQGKLLLSIYSISRDIKDYLTLCNTITDKKEMIQEQAQAVYTMLANREPKKDS